MDAVSEELEFATEPQALAGLQLTTGKSAGNAAATPLSEARFELPRVARRNDALLRPFLDAESESEAQRCLEVLLQRAAPIVVRAVRQNRHVTPNRARGRYEKQEEQEADDIYQDALALLIDRLRALRSDRALAPIARYCAYVAATATHVCHERLRRAAPNRQAGKDRLRYLLTSVSGLALWRDDWGRTVCGLSDWQGRPASRAALLRLQAFQENPENPETLEHRTRPDTGFALPSQQWRSEEDGAQQAPFSVPLQEWLWDGALSGTGLASLLAWIGGPVTPQHLAAALIGVLGTQEITACACPATWGDEADGQAEDPLAKVEDERVDVAGQVEQRDFLCGLWREITLLPPMQRAALLLNLRDGQGRGVLALLAHTRVATPTQIAEALPLPADTLAALWPALPIEDAAIAQVLGMTRQQVINLRKVARARLTRRLREQP